MDLGMEKRIIVPEMVDFFDKRLARDEGALIARAKGLPNALVLRAALVCVGIREEGNNTGPMVRLFQDTIGAPDPWAWCMSFAQTCIAYVEVTTGLESPIFPSEHVLTVWNKTPKTQRYASGFPGYLAMYQRIGTTQGHVAVTELHAASALDAVEGNTTFRAPGGPVVRDGGGVEKTRRYPHSDAAMPLLGFLKPF